jgi:hypothetical protein
MTFIGRPGRIFAAESGAVPRYRQMRLVSISGIENVAHDPSTDA